MKWLTPILICILVSSATAAQKTYDTGTIVDIQQKTHTRVLYYIVNTPVTKDDPYYEVSVQVKDVVLLGEYTPRHSDDSLPDWKPGDKVEVRTDNHHLYLKSPGGSDLNLDLVKRTPVAPAK